MRALTAEVDQWKSDGIALLAAGTAFAITYLTWPLLSLTAWALFFGAVMLAAWFGRVRSTLLATALSAAIGNRDFIAPFGEWSLTYERVVATCTFLMVSLFMGLLASARRQAELFERAERRRFQATMRSIGDGVIATDRRGIVRFMNDVAEALTGWTRHEAVGKPLETVFLIINEGTRATTPNPVRKVLEAGRIQGLANHTVMISRGGVERPIDDSASPIRDDHGAIIGVVLVFRDITDRKRAEDDLREANARTDELRAMLAHELRNPLAAIGNAVQFTSVEGGLQEHVP
jgi:PAS domain S-box-containing protein